MRFKSISLSVVVLVCAALMLVSCRSISIGAGSGRRRVYRHGPPPHAPAHGYRHKYEGVELVYDSGRGVYVVIDLPNHYYFKGRYYRRGEVQWEACVHIDGPWEFVSEDAMPKGLRAKEKVKVKAKGKSKEHPGRGLGLEKNR
jgi:hypothetical protein